MSDVAWILFALGDCGNLLKPDACTYTEWFDVDEPCKVDEKTSANEPLEGIPTVGGRYGVRRSKHGRRRELPSDWPLPHVSKVQANGRPAVQDDRGRRHSRFAIG